MQIIECRVPFPADLKIHDGRHTTLSMGKGDFIATDPLRNHESWLVSRDGFKRIFVKDCVIPITLVEVRSVFR